MIDAYLLLIFAVVFCGLLIGSMTDLRTREVPDCLSFSLIALGLSFAAIASLVMWDLAYIISSLIGFVFCFSLACLMFYTGQWGGGDAKILMAMGALLGFPLSFILSFVHVGSISSLSDIPLLLVFIPLILVLGGVYGFFWMFVLLVRHWKEFSKNYMVALSQKKNRRIRHVMFVLVAICFLVGLFASDIFMRILGVVLGLMFFILYYLFLAVKIIEHVALVKKVAVSVVTEGDWVARDVVVEGKLVVSKNDLGVSEEQLRMLQSLSKKKKLRSVYVRYGIPFLPSFLLAFVVSVVVYII